MVFFLESLAMGGFTVLVSFYDEGVALEGFRRKSSRRRSKSRASIEADEKHASHSYVRV